jgi:Sap, sulfolipid-1-addressing protein
VGTGDRVRPRAARSGTGAELVGAAGPKAKSNGLSLLAGWVVGVAAAGATLLAVVGPSATSDEGQPDDWTFWLKLALGALLFVVGMREWRGRPGAGGEVELPKWMSRRHGGPHPGDRREAHRRRHGRALIVTGDPLVPTELAALGAPMAAVTAASSDAIADSGGKSCKKARRPSV